MFGGRGRIGNMVGKLRDIAKAFKREVKVWQLVLKDPRTPRAAKWLLGLAVGYALLPFDFIPDAIPVLGQLDDLLIIPLLVGLARTLIPNAIVEDCRARLALQ